MNNENNNDAKVKYEFDSHMSNKEITDLIDNYVRSERDRYLLKRKFIDDISYECLSEELGIDTSTAKRIVKERFLHLQDILKGR